MKFSLSTLQLLVALVAFSVTSPVKAQESIAITEFMNEPRGTQSLTEWIELYNFGASTVNLTGWNLKDDDTDNATLPNTSIPAGGFLILARNKAQFEADWLAGFPSSQVVQWVPSGATTTFALSASADEIILRNAALVFVR